MKAGKAALLGKGSPCFDLLCRFIVFLTHSFSISHRTDVHNSAIFFFFFFSAVRSPD